MTDEDFFQKVKSASLFCKPIKEHKRYFNSILDSSPVAVCFALADSMFFVICTALA